METFEGITQMSAADWLGAGYAGPRETLMAHHLEEGSTEEDVLAAAVRACRFVVEDGVSIIGGVEAVARQFETWMDEVWP